MADTPAVTDARPTGAPGSGAPDAGTNVDANPASESSKTSGKQFYAWSRFPVSVDEKGKVKNINVGDPISKSDLDVNDEEWENYIEIGAVRSVKYPSKEKLGSMSPSDFFRQQLARAAEGDLTDNEVSELVS